MTARSRGKRSLEHRDGWNEDDHPRDDDGKFTDKGGGSSGKSEKSKPELKEKKNKQLSEKNIKNLKVASEKEFSDVVDKFTARDYKDIPNVTRLPDFDKGLADKLGLSNGNAYLTKEGTKHINPERKGKQAFRDEEYKAIPKVVSEAKFAVYDKTEKNFHIVFDDKQNSKMINKIVFDTCKSGSYIKTIGKIERSSYRDKKFEIIGVGVAPTISGLRYARRRARY